MGVFLRLLLCLHLVGERLLGRQAFRGIHPNESLLCAAPDISCLLLTLGPKENTEVSLSHPSRWNSHVFNRWWSGKQPLPFHTALLLYFLFFLSSLSGTLLFSFRLKNLERLQLQDYQALHNFDCHKSRQADDKWRNGGIRGLPMITAGWSEQRNWACPSWGSDLKHVIPARSLCKREKDFLSSIWNKRFTFVNSTIFRKRVWSSALN